jgi:hypothetical protein
MQKRVALANADILKSDGDRADYENAAAPHDNDEPFDRKMARLTKEHGIGRDAAITMIYRSEKQAKGGV